MKKLILIFITIGLFTSCTINQKQPCNGDIPEPTLDGYTVKRYDGCQYLEKTRTILDKGYGYLAHKGNCDNPIHLYNTRITTSPND